MLKASTSGAKTLRARFTMLFRRRVYSAASATGFEALNVMNDVLRPDDVDPSWANTMHRTLQIRTYAIQLPLARPASTIEPRAEGVVR